MDDKKFDAIEQRLIQQDISRDELKIVVLEIRDALLGSLDGDVIGLIADHRNLRAQVANHDAQLAEHTQSLQELKGFRRDIRKMVAFVAFAIPFAFEMVKGIVVVIWEYLKNHK
jgi:hypothetical protein